MPALSIRSLLASNRMYEDFAVSSSLMVANACVASHPRVIMLNFCLYSITCCFTMVLYAHALFLPNLLLASVGLQPSCNIMCTNSACASVISLIGRNVFALLSISFMGTLLLLYRSCCITSALVISVESSGYGMIIHSSHLSCQCTGANHLFLLELFQLYSLRSKLLTSSTRRCVDPFG